MSLPRTADDVLAIDADDIPETIRSLLEDRGLSDLISGLNAALVSSDVAIGARAREALEHLGFVV